MCARQLSPTVRSAALVLGLAGLPFIALAQATPSTAPAVDSGARTSGPNERIERIIHEDAGSRIDELRVGGQTRNITVQPKNGAPSYEVAPARGGEDMSDANSGSSASTGRSRWRLLSF
ncbi:MAG: hypothetical protein ACLGG8_00990 [Gammaproteobacteria bacterium]